jgi:excisionase family DNA binding protein
MTGRLLTAREVSELLGWNTETVLRKVRNGQIPAIRLPGGAIRFETTTLEAWLVAHATNAPTSPGAPAPLTRPGAGHKGG